MYMYFDNNLNLIFIWQTKHLFYNTIICIYVLFLDVRTEYKLSCGDSTRLYRCISGFHEDSATGAAHKHCHSRIVPIYTEKQEVTWREVKEVVATIYKQDLSSMPYTVMRNAFEKVKTDRAALMKIKVQDRGNLITEFLAKKWQLPTLTKN